MTSPQPETLTQLLAGALADGLTYSTLEDRAVDKASGYRPSRATLWKVANGKGGVQITPELILAIAAGIGVPPERAQRAAAAQYIGLVVTPVGRGAVVRTADAPPSDLQRERDIVAKWDDEDVDRRNHPGT